MTDQIAFRTIMETIINEIAARHWREIHRRIHYHTRSEGQKRRYAKTIHTTRES